MKERASELKKDAVKPAADVTPARGVLIVLAVIGLILTTIAVVVAGAAASSSLFEGSKSGKIGAAAGMLLAGLLWRWFLQRLGFDLSSFRK